MFPGRCFPRCFLTVSPTASYKTNVKTTFSGKKIYEFAKCPLKKYVYVQTYIPLHHAGDKFRQWQIFKKTFATAKCLQAQTGTQCYAYCVTYAMLRILCNGRTSIMGS